MLTASSAPSVREHWMATALLSFIPVVGWAALIYMRSWSYPQRARLYAHSIRVGLTADAVVVVRNVGLLHDPAASAADVLMQVIRIADLTTVRSVGESVWISTAGRSTAVVEGLVNATLFRSTLLSAITGSALSVEPALGVLLPANAATKV